MRTFSPEARVFSPETLANSGDWGRSIVVAGQWYRPKDMGRQGWSLKIKSSCPGVARTRVLFTHKKTSSVISLKIDPKYFQESLESILGYLALGSAELIKVQISETRAEKYCAPAKAQPVGRTIGDYTDAELLAELQGRVKPTKRRKNRPETPTNVIKLRLATLDGMSAEQKQAA